MKPANYMVWGGIIEAIKSSYNEPKHRAKERFHIETLHVVINQENISLSSLYCNNKTYQEFVRRKSETRKTIVRLKTELSVSDKEIKKDFWFPFLKLIKNSLS